MPCELVCTEWLFVRHHRSRIGFRVGVEFWNRGKPLWSIAIMNLCVFQDTVDIVHARVVCVHVCVCVCVCVCRVCVCVCGASLCALAVFTIILALPFLSMSLTV